jgi:hypothetical protein
VSSTWSRLLAVTVFAQLLGSKFEPTEAKRAQLEAELLLFESLHATTSEAGEAAGAGTYAEAGGESLHCSPHLRRAASHAAKGDSLVCAHMRKAGPVVVTTVAAGSAICVEARQGPCCMEKGSHCPSIYQHKGAKDVPGNYHGSSLARCMHPSCHIASPARYKAGSVKAGYVKAGSVKRNSGSSGLTSGGHGR